MKGFHSTISRRQFMKGLGLAGAGLGAAVAAAPVFHDLDELAASASNVSQDYPWWVKQREHFDPTCTVDWNVFDRHDGYNHQGAYMGPQDIPYNEIDMRIPRHMMAAEQAEAIIEMKKKRFPDWDPGLHGKGDQRADALFSAIMPPIAFGYSHPVAPGKILGMYCLHGPPWDPGPPDPSTPKWQGTPEDNLLMMRAAVRYFGFGDASALDLSDPKCKKLIYKKHQPFQTRGVLKNPSIDIFVPPVPDHPVPIVFEDEEYGYYNDEKWVIPNNAQWILSYTASQPEEMTKRTGGLQGAGGYRNYQDFSWVTIRIQRFLKGLGYQAMAQVIGWGPGGSFGTFNGMGECGRTGAMIHWKYGSSQRGPLQIITDMPLAPGRPIDAGMMRFCRDCMICRRVCVSKGVDQNDEPRWDSGHWWNQQGALRYYTDWRGCINQCGQCQAWCPFTTLQHGSMVHNIVKAVVAKTPIFNSFFQNMEETLGYGSMILEEGGFWERAGPMYGFSEGH